MDRAHNIDSINSRIVVGKRITCILQKLHFIVRFLLCRVSQSREKKII